MKTFRLKDLIDNKDNPKIVKKILDSTELSKLDKKDLLKDLKGINTNKEELILDSDTIQQKCYFLNYDNINEFYSSDINYNNAEILYRDFEEFGFVKFGEMRRQSPDRIIGCRFNILHGYEYEFDTDPNFKEYFIEVPFTRFYDKNTNFFYFANGDRVEAGKKLYKTLSKLNLTEGEWFVPNGYIFMITDVGADDRGFITKVRKIGNIFEYESFLNAGRQPIAQLSSTGEVKYLE